MLMRISGWGRLANCIGRPDYPELPLLSRCLGWMDATYIWKLNRPPELTERGEKERDEYNFLCQLQSKRLLLLFLCLHELPSAQRFVQGEF